jgi:hypothetical protein
MLVVRDVDIQALSATSLTVLSAAPAVTGRECAVRVTAAGRAQVTLRVKATHCHPVLIDGRRRHRVVYAVLGPEAQAPA